MKKLILVALKRHDRVEDLMPYVEEVVRPGMKAVFMVPYPVDGFRWSHEEIGRKAIEEGKRLASYYAWDSNLRRAEELIAPALKALPVKGIEVAVDLYAGSMRRALRDYEVKSDVHLIVTRASVGNWIERVVDAAPSALRSLIRPSFSPVLLINPRTLRI
jgi:hypothetical protein